MLDNNIKNLVSLKQKWESSLRSHSLEDLLFIACSGFIESSKVDNEEYKELFIRYMKSSLFLVEDNGGVDDPLNVSEIQCSFCHSSFTQDFILRGVGVAICEDCISFGQDALKKKR